MISRNFIVGVLLCVPILSWGQTPNSKCDMQVAIPDGIYLLTQPYHFQLDTNFTYAVIFNDEVLELSKENEFTINSNKRIGKLKIYKLDDNDTNLVVERKLRFYPPDFTVICFNKYSGDTINKNDLDKPYTKIELLNYDLNIHFTPKQVKLRFINFSGESQYFEFEGYDIPQYVQKFLKSTKKGVLIFEMILEIGTQKEYIKPTIYYYDKDG